MRESDLIERLGRVIQARGENYKSVSIRAKLGETAVRDILVGRVKNPGIYTLEKIANALDTTISQVMEAEPRVLRVTSYVGEDGEILPSEPNSVPDEVECPLGLLPGAVVAIRVKGDYMYPLLQKEWIVYYSEGKDTRIPVIADGFQVPYNPPGDDPMAEFFNKPCIVKLRNGRTILRTLKKGSVAGKYNLIAYTRPAMDDVEIEWAAKIMYIKTA
jgi:transcriptional regulator with XRE-family HTH domain